jgi:hypothetical protein
LNVYQDYACFVHLRPLGHLPVQVLLGGQKRIFAIFCRRLGRANAFAANAFAAFAFAAFAGLMVAMAKSVGNVCFLIALLPLARWWRWRRARAMFANLIADSALSTRLSAFSNSHRNILRWFLIPFLVSNVLWLRALPEDILPEDILPHLRKA